jgi:hypothetical protein
MGTVIYCVYSLSPAGRRSVTSTIARTKYLPVFGPVWICTHRRFQLSAKATMRRRGRARANQEDENRRIGLQIPCSPPRCFSLYFLTPTIPMLRSNVLLLLLAFPQSFTAVLAAVTRQFDQVVAFGDNLADAGYVGPRTMSHLN